MKLSQASFWAGALGTIELTVPTQLVSKGEMTSQASVVSNRLDDLRVCEGRVVRLESSVFEVISSLPSYFVPMTTT